MNNNLTISNNMPNLKKYRKIEFQKSCEVKFKLLQRTNNKILNFQNITIDVPLINNQYNYKDIRSYLFKMQNKQNIIQKRNNENVKVSVNINKNLSIIKTKCEDINNIY